MSHSVDWGKNKGISSLAMDGRTRAAIIEERDRYIEARVAIAERGIAYTLPNGVALTYSDLDTVQWHISRLTRELEAHDADLAGSINPSVSFAKWRIPTES